MTFTLPLKDWTQTHTSSLEAALRVVRGEVYWQHPSAEGVLSNSTEDPCWSGDDVTSIRLVYDTEFTCPKAD